MKVPKSNLVDSSMSHHIKAIGDSVVADRVVVVPDRDPVVVSMPPIKFADIVPDDVIRNAIVKAESLKILSVEDERGFSEVHEMRMWFKNRRIEVEKRAKLLKEEVLVYTKSVDEEKRRLIALMEPMENHLKSQEDEHAASKKRLIEEAEAKRREFIASRVRQIMQHGRDHIHYLNGDYVMTVQGLPDLMINERILDSCDDIAFANLLERVDTYKQEKDRQIKEAALEEQKRREEEERIAENKRMEEVRLLEEARLKQEERDRDLQARQMELDAKNAEIEKMRAEVEMAQKKVREEREAEIREQERVFREQARKDAMELKMKRQLAVAPDYDKLIALAVTLSRIELPIMSTQSGAMLLGKINELLSKTIIFINEKSKQLIQEENAI